MLACGPKNSGDGCLLSQTRQPGYKGDLGLGYIRYQKRFLPNRLQ